MGDLRELKSRKECKYCIRASKLVYKSRRSICCIGRRLNGAILRSRMLDSVDINVSYALKMPIKGKRLVDGVELG